MKFGSQLLLLCLVAGCFRDPDGERAANSPLLHSPDAAGVFDLDKAATDPEILRRIVLATHRETTTKLGAHSFRGTHSMRVTENGKAVEKLEETTALDMGKTGSFHVVYENSRDYGREAYFDRKARIVWVRPRYGKYHRRAPATRDEPARLTNDVYATLAADYELVAHAIDIKDLGTTRVDGRQARKLKLSLGKVRLPATQELSHKQWRENFAVTELSGELVFDNTTGALLSGRLASKGQLVKKGRTFDLALTSTHKLTTQSIAFEFPSDEESVETPTRPADVADREKLLRGIAPPMRGRHPPTTKQD